MKRSVPIIVTFTLASFFFSLSPSHLKNSLTLVDTSECDQFLYQPMLDILASVGFKVNYIPLDNVIDAPLALASNDAVFFLFGKEFLSGNRQSHLWGKIVRALSHYARLKGKLIGLFFPSLLGLKPNANVIDMLMPLFQALGCSLVRLPWNESVMSWITMSGTSPSVNDFMQLTNTFIVNALENRPLRYHTTLHMPHGGTYFDIEQIQNEVSQRTQSLFLLPRAATCSEIVRQTLPYGVYWFNPLYKNHVLISTTSLLTFAGIAENYRFCPIDVGIRQEMLAMAQRMLWEVVCLAQLSSSKKQPELPSSATSFGFVTAGMPRERGSKTAWMEITVFDETKVKRAEELVQRRDQQDKLIDYIIKSGLDALWITFNPHMYYSPIARSLVGLDLEKEADREQREKIIRQWTMGISNFTKKLSEAAVASHCPIPRIMVGFEITNNLYDANRPATYPIDVYENGYRDLPVPLNRLFWQQEIVEPLEKFVKLWRDQEISHGISLSGVVLDLEMYCREKTGLFLNTMTIDADTFSTFEPMTKDTSIRDRVLMLMQKGKAQAYFAFLEREARAIGNYVRAECASRIPQCQLMCYLPNLQVSWFYKGLCKGLARVDAPLHLLTFNSEFFAHESWFKKYNIPVKHSTVLMLCKLTSEQDFNWVDLLGARHHGLWFNRFSHFVEPKPVGWTSLEQPMMPESSYSVFMKYLHEH
ncbi:MAG: hypothetical protein WCW33_06520 [Candidatus Babeliales bacterium]|jgi:hypothetical protein